MLDKALLSVVKNALEQASLNGLLDSHYFYLTFKTNAKGVVIPEFLRSQYPETLTIIIQHEYSNLSVSEKEFGVTLSFNNHNYEEIFYCSIIGPGTACIKLHEWPGNIN